MTKSQYAKHLHVSDTKQLGTAQWFEQHNPTAQAQILERMAEAIRKGYWDASEATRRALAERWQQLAEQFQIDTGAPLTRRYIADMASGFGLHAGPKPEAAATADAPADTAEGSNHAHEHSVQGHVMTPSTPDSNPDHHTTLWALTIMLLLIASGAMWQAQQGRKPR